MGSDRRGRRDASAGTGRRSSTAGTPAARNRAGVQTRAIVLSEAERLFAERGIDCVSVRDITDAASANTAAVHYYFGSKRDLVVALIDQRAADLGRRRASHLKTLESEGVPDVRAVAAALVRPTAELVGESSGGRHYVQFIKRLASTPEYGPLLEEAYEPHTRRYLELLERVTPHLGDEIRLLRFAAAKELVNQLLGDHGGPISRWMDGHGKWDRTSLVEALTDMIVGLFMAPAKELDDPAVDATSASGRRSARRNARGRGAREAE